jgi:hypothetical protein
MTKTTDTTFRVYYAPVGHAPAFCGEFSTAAEAEAHAETSPGGLNQADWETARTAGHVNGHTAPNVSGVEQDEPIDWIGSYCIVGVDQVR